MQGPVLHIDLDAFYAQVEQVRLKLPPSQPLTVQQWGGLIAVNYAARPFGIKRSTTAKEALLLCPHVHNQHVAVFVGEETKSQYHPNPNYMNHKACLDVYRKASRAVMQIFKEYDPHFERASIDEGRVFLVYFVAYFDVSDIIERQIESGEWREILAVEGDINEVIVKWAGLGVLAYDASITESSGIPRAYIKECRISDYALPQIYPTKYALRYSKGSGIPVPVESHTTRLLRK
jgi:hypothetical protein